MPVAAPPVAPGGPGGLPLTGFSFGPPRPPVTIVHRPTKEARKAEIVAAVTKRLYTQKKKPDLRADQQTPPPASLPDTTEEAEDEPRELKLCSNARARLQEISKRALALSLHRKRRDSETQTETPGVLRLKERAVGTETLQLADKASQWPLHQPFFLRPVSYPRRGSDSSEVYSDDSLDHQPVELGRGLNVQPPISLWRAFSLRSEGTFAPKRPEVAPNTPHWHQCCQTDTKCKVDAATSVQCDVSTITRDTETMTIDSTEKATMTSHEVDVATMTTEEERGAPRDTGTMTESEGHAAKTETSPPQQAPEYLMQLLCDVRVSCLPPFAMASVPPTCSYRVVVPPQVPGQPVLLTSGKSMPSGPPEGPTQVPGQATNATPTAPPDIIAQAGSGRLDGGGGAAEGVTTVVKLQEPSRQLLSVEIVRPVSHREFLSLPACPGHPDGEAIRSRSLDSLLVQLDGPAPSPPAPAPTEASVPPQQQPQQQATQTRKFRLPCFAENLGDPPKPTATARPVREDRVREEVAAGEEICWSRSTPRCRPALTYRQRRLLLKLLEARVERSRRRRPRRRRPRSPRSPRPRSPRSPRPRSPRSPRPRSPRSPRPRSPRSPRPRSPRPRSPRSPRPRSPHSQGYIELRPSRTLLELAERRCAAGTMTDASTQSCRDAGAQCAILRTAYSLSKATQCDVASKRTFSSQTPSDPMGVDPTPCSLPHPARFLDDEWLPPRIPFLCCKPPPTPILLRRPSVVPCFLPRLSRPVPSPREYLRHLVSLRRHVVLASRTDVRRSVFS